jgi:pyrimidine-nucleoside phosphorylase
MAEEALASGKAWEKFRVLVQAQGGDLGFIDEPQRLPSAPVIEEVKAERAGWLQSIDAREIGETAVSMGAGRARKSDPIDYGVGIRVHRKVGDAVQAGDVLFTLYARDTDSLPAVRERLIKALTWSESACQTLPLFYGIIE